MRSLSLASRPGQNSVNVLQIDRSPWSRTLIPLGYPPYQPLTSVQETRQPVTPFHFCTLLQSPIFSIVLDNRCPYQEPNPLERDLLSNPGVCLSTLITRKPGGGTSLIADDMTMQQVVLASMVTQSIGRIIWLFCFVLFWQIFSTIEKSKKNSQVLIYFRVLLFEFYDSRMTCKFP